MTHRIGIVVFAACLVFGGAFAQDAPGGGKDAVDVDALRAELDALGAEIFGARDAIVTLAERSDRAEGEDRVLLERRRMRKVLAVLEDVDEFVDGTVRLREAGAPAPDLETSAREMVTFAEPALRARIEVVRAQRDAVARERDTAEGEALVDLERRVADLGDTLNTLYAALLDNADRARALGLDASETYAFLEAAVSDRVESAAARLEYALEQIEVARERLKDLPDDSGLQARLTAAREKRDRSAAHLRASIAMLERLGLDHAEYQQLLLRATGQVTADLLDQRVARTLIEQWLGSARAWVRENGPTWVFKVVVFLLILAAFWVLARIMRSVVRRAAASSRLNLSKLLQDMFVRVVGNLVFVLGILIALSQLGVSLGPLLAGLGIAGFIVGFALQDTLGNFAAGLMILMYRPYDVGDLVEASGAFGKVSAMSMVSTTILTIDNQTLIIPNSKIWGDVIKNVTAQRERRVDLVFGISYSDDIPKAERILESILAEHPKVLDDPEPMVKLHTLNDSSVDFVVRPWVKTEDYWDVHWDVTRAVKMRFDEEGVSIPFPQRDVHLYRD